MKKNGFTLVEVLAVISILGVVIVFVVPNLLSAFYKSRDILSDYEKNTIKDAGKMYITDLDNGIKSYNGYSGYEFKKYAVANSGITVSLTTLIDEGYYDDACTSKLCQKYQKSKLDDSSSKVECNLNLTLSATEENGYLVTTGYDATLSGKDCE